MSGRIVTVGASAGGIEALGTLVAQLPSRLNASVITAVHMPSGANSRLAELLDKRGALPALPARDGEQIQCGRIYVGPPDFHILVRPRLLRLLHGPREQGMRPSINALFRSAARTYGQAVIGVVLSGALDDGAAGLAEIKRAGGVTIVQDPAEALFPSMPRSALERTDVDHCLPADRIGTVIGQLAGEATERAGTMPAVVNESPEPDPLEVTAESAWAEPPGMPSRLACPECGGVLWKDPGDGDPSFRCRVGHAYSLASLGTEHHPAVEEALWAAVRSLEEEALLAARLAERARATGHGRAESTFSDRAAMAERHAERVRELIYGRRGANAGPSGS